MAEEAKEFQRIIYVEPNDVFDNDNQVRQGLSLTPKYEDMCISFNLIIEAFSRFKSSGTSSSSQTDSNGNNTSKTYVIEWGLTQEDMIKKRTSVLQGDRGDYTIDDKGGYNFVNNDYNYLTTYYTDISFDSYKEKTQIEGLGVESVQISYESWYTPTVTIKFVDVRGSALWGREEAVHVNEKLTVDNVFGAFFTMPYPLFRLQVKGFFGKPVTYQLTCSSFKGEFNTNTGNFEAIATFIGYSWSLLTDIPFAYLVAAPYATYIGAEYWERKKNSSEWGLWADDGHQLPPPKLFDLFNMIRSADSRLESEYSASTNEQNEKLQSMKNEIQMLNDISTTFNSYKSAIQSEVDGKYISAFDMQEKKDQLLLFSDMEEIKLKQDTIDKYSKFYNSLQTYATTYTGNSITLDKSPNKWKDTSITTLRLLDRFVITTEEEGSKITSITVKGTTQSTTQQIERIKFNDTTSGGFLTTETIKELLNGINGEKLNKNIKKNAYLIDFYDIRTLVNDRLKELAIEKKNLVEEINNNINYNIENILTFKPFIGNIFKIIFCHLETFFHIMYESGQKIYSQCNTNERLPEVLGIDMNNTDIVANVTKNVVPWPAIYDKGKHTKQCGYESDIENIYGWVGDFSHKFEEEKVVYSIQEGIQQIVKSLSDNSHKTELNSFPITPSDFIFNGNPFGMAEKGTLSDISANLAMRCAYIIGVLSGNNIPLDMAKTMGRMDAYNLYNQFGGIGLFKQLLEDKDVETIKSIAYCDISADMWAMGKNETNDTVYHMFETSPKIKYSNNRHPIFKKDGNKNLFVHWYDAKDIGYVPTTIKPFRNYSKEDFEYQYENNKQYFDPKIHQRSDGATQSYDWVYNSDSNKLDIKITGDIETYVNKYMFNVISDKKVDTIENIVDRLGQGGAKVYDYEVTDDFSGIINRFLKVGKKPKSRFFNGVGNMLSGNIAKLNIDKNKLLDKILSKNNNDTFDFTYNVWNKNEGNVVGVNSDGDFTFNNETISTSDLVIQQFKISQFGHECNLFGCPFYYLQNEIEDEKVRMRVKALLFLHTFKYDYNAVMNVFANDKKNGGMESVPKAYLLLIGGLLWRRRQYNVDDDNKTDPIKYDAGIFKYKQPGIDNTFFINNNGFVMRTVKEGGSESLSYNVSIKQMLGGSLDIDYNIENQLIKLFEDFVEKSFGKYVYKYELSDHISENESIEYSHNGLLTDIEDLVDFVKNNNKEGFKKWLNTYGINKWEHYYSAINVDTQVNYTEQGLMLLMNENDTESQEFFKDLYYGTYIVADSCHRRMGKSSGNTLSTDQIYVRDDLYNSYLSGFTNAVSDIINSTNNGSNDYDGLNFSEETKKNRDLSIPVYYYLKNLWDRWLVVAREDSYDVKNFFMKNFVFIDSFYKNTYHYLAVNCDKLLENWDRLADNASLFHFLSKITSDHHCLFVPVPDFIGFNGQSQKADIELLKDVFRPMPYEDIPAPSNNNKFIVMYTHPYSSTSSEDNGYKLDSYDIWSNTYGTDGITDIAKALFKSTTDPDFDIKNDIATKEGYNVPSFGVSFAKQNNHLFKNLKVNMENPVMTEQSIKTQMEIARMGSGGGRKVCFIGQDTFNVFTNYSYSVTVEMMGNAQICPLMYFQLTNIPMWRGTYMIYKVVHNMTPGNMTTTFTAMKMSKYAKPFNTAFLVRKPEYDDDTNPASFGGNNGSYSNSCDNDTNDTYVGGVIEGTYGKSGIFSGKTREEKMKMYGVGNKKLSPQEAKNGGLIVDVTFNQTGGTKTLPMNKYIAEDFKAICDEILALGWFKLDVGNCYRSANSLKNGVSRHCWGIAVDINPGNGGNPWFNTRITKTQSEPANGSKPWPVKQCDCKGGYDRCKCVWHWNHPVVQIFLKHGWGWGGSYGDVMHFSVDDGH